MRKLLNQSAAVFALTAGLALPAASQVTYISYPPETIRTELTHDSASLDLQVKCVSASQGVCHIFVSDAGVQRSVTLRPGKRATFKNVSSKARYCTMGRDPTMACHWQPVAPNI